MTKKPVKTQEEKQQEKEQRARIRAERREAKERAFIISHSSLCIESMPKKDFDLYRTILKDMVNMRAVNKLIKARDITIAAIKESDALFDVVKDNPAFRPSYLPSLVEAS